MIIFLLISNFILATDVTSMTIGDVAANLQKTFPAIIQMLVAVAYISGIGFGIAAIFKLKQVKDNPTQIPISTPFALLATSALLVFLPSLFSPVGVTLFGRNAVVGSVSGTGMSNFSSSSVD